MLLRKMSFYKYSRADNVEIFRNLHSKIKTQEDILEEHFIKGISQVELAGFYGVNQSSISRKISRIVKKLKKFLEN